ncbi:MAG: zinc ribbon domain-containing protein [Deltaproteobacteria bacterium]|jgi:putative FmdB family regulatory protein|nr:zinc ribbon domain-containing protein [Deltaproteobacteria bacterium]
MPIYEFECSQCHQVTEALLKFSDQPLTVCPHCGGHLAKLMSMNSFQLKGGGWYATDYAKKSDKSSPLATKPKEASSEKSASGSEGSTASSKDKSSKEA